MVIIGACDIERIGCPKWPRLFIVKRQPVCKMKTALDQMSAFLLFFQSALIIHPRLHSRIGLGKQCFAAVMKIYIPWNDHAGIPPWTASVLRDHPFLDARHNVWHCSSDHTLLRTHIPEIFPVKCGHVHVIAGGLRKYLRISRPPQTLVALRTVCRHVQKIIFLSPQGV